MTLRLSIFFTVTYKNPGRRDNGINLEEEVGDNKSNPTKKNIIQRIKNFLTKKEDIITLYNKPAEKNPTKQENNINDNEDNDP